MRIIMIITAGRHALFCLSIEREASLVVKLINYCITYIKNNRTLLTLMFDWCSEEFYHALESGLYSERQYHHHYHNNNDDDYGNDICLAEYPIIYFHNNMQIILTCTKFKRASEIQNDANI